MRCHAAIGTFIVNSIKHISDTVANINDNLLHPIELNAFIHTNENAYIIAHIMQRFINSIHSPFYMINLRVSWYDYL